MNKVTLGGDRLGAGKKMKVGLHGYERSTHDLGYIFRTSMSAGTLVPFMSMVGLPGDSFDIDLNADVKTYPTVGPMFGSFKLQMDVFSVPIRLYNGWLHNNKLNVGMKMEQVLLPYIDVEAWPLDFNSKIPLEMQQINQSSLLAYLGIRGVGKEGIRGGGEAFSKEFNAIPYLSYWDIYKNYYANKQEEIGALVHTSEIPTHNWWQLYDGDVYIPKTEFVSLNLQTLVGKTMVIQVDQFSAGENGKNVMLVVGGVNKALSELFDSVNVYDAQNDITGELKWYSFVNCQELKSGVTGTITNVVFVDAQASDYNIAVETFQLDNIDKMREDILKTDGNLGFGINKNTYAPYGLPLKIIAGNKQCTSQFSQEGLAIKTYQSDIFNNWLKTEWIDGEDGINKITAISTAGDYFTLDQLQLSKKVYDMLNRIAVSGGSYNDWMSANWDTKPYNSAETPMYMGGLSKEVVFQEVVSTAKADTDNPLGSLAGKGGMAKKHKGGSVKIKVTEPSYIIGIVSLTPRIDYSQGNNWDTKLKTMNDFHKPALDGIGFQDLDTNLMAFWDSGYSETYSAGKQPAWINYQTNFNKCFGNFADSRKEMFMTLNRRYEADADTKRIKDLTTYIDPVKYNYIFAQSSLDAQNFWTQIGVDITARRKMSAKIMPNL